MNWQENPKKIQFDGFSLWLHVLLLCLPMLIFAGIFFVFFPHNSLMWMILSLICVIYAVSYSLIHYVYQGRLQRLLDHIDQVVSLNDTSFEMFQLSSQFQTEHAFLDALLTKAVNAVIGAEMGCIIRVNTDNNKLLFESCIGMDINRLNTVDLKLEQTFEYRLTNGKCDEVVVVNDIAKFNADSGLTSNEQETLLTVSSSAIHSTLSSPLYVAGKLYAMLNLDSSQANAFSDYDRNLVAILTHEAANAIALYQKSQEIHKLAHFDALTDVFNRRHFEASLGKWKHNPGLGSFVAIITIDNLKKVNQQFGHETGDETLKQLGLTLSKLWHKDAMLARFGGDEFVLLAHGPEGKLANTLRAVQLQCQHSNPKVALSFGIAPYLAHWDTAFNQARQALLQHQPHRKAQYD